MVCSRTHWGVLAVLIGLSDYRMYEYEKHERFAAIMIEVERELWEWIETKQVPDGRRESIMQAVYGPQTTLDDQADVLLTVDELLKSKAARFPITGATAL